MHMYIKDRIFPEYKVLRETSGNHQNPTSTCLVKKMPLRPRDFTQYFVITYMGRESEKGKKKYIYIYTYIFITESLC